MKRAMVDCGVGQVIERGGCQQAENEVEDAVILRDKDLVERPDSGRTWDEAVEAHLKAKEEERIRHEKLSLLAQAYKEGLEAGGKEEAERRMQAKLDEINPSKTEAE